MVEDQNSGRASGLLNPDEVVHCHRVVLVQVAGAPQVHVAGNHLVELAAGRGNVQKHGELYRLVL
jgi:hypothetical protein